MELSRRSYLAAGVVTATAGLIAATPVAPPPAEAQQRAIALAAGEEDIVLDLVRHGSDGPVSYLSTIGSYLPGYPLNATGQEQATAVASFLEQGAPYAGIYAGENLRMIQTAQPLADALHMNITELPGLDEIAGGIYNGDPSASPGGILYDLTLAAWVFGLDSVPMGGSYDLNGVSFDEGFSNAVASIYDSTVSSGGSTTDVAFSGEAAISTWSLMNAKNPDVAIFLPLFAEDLVGGKDFLPNTGVVVLQGDPTEGWTLVSFDGRSIPQDPGLLTQLIVDVRDLITPPQIAAYNVTEALFAGDPTAVGAALEEGLQNIGAAIVQFPVSVIGDTASAVQNLVADVAAGEAFNIAFDALFLGIV
jgi:hypothetical protein